MKYTKEGEHQGHVIISGDYEWWENPRNEEGNITVMCLNNSRRNPHYEGDRVGIPKAAFDLRLARANGSVYDRFMYAMEWVTRKKCPVLVARPVYRYEHGGVAYSTEPFSCPWDSGMAGVIFITVKDYVAAFGPIPDTAEGKAEAEAKALALLVADVNTYSMWANNSGYEVGYVLAEHVDDEEGDKVEIEDNSLVEWVTGPVDYVGQEQVAEVKAYIDRAIEYQAKLAAEMKIEVALDN